MTYALFIIQSVGLILDIVGVSLVYSQPGKMPKRPPFSLDEDQTYRLFQALATEPLKYRVIAPPWLSSPACAGGRYLDLRG
ncbi:MAG: hypothetical protein ABFD08_14170 [Syntrophomonas sp.]